MTTAKPLSCSFCKKPQHVCRHLLTSEVAEASICDRCIERAVVIIDREREKKRKARLAPQHGVMA